MNPSTRAYLSATAIAVLLVINGLIALQLFFPRAHTLRVSFLDVGQGDAILIQGPTGRTLLVDGGPDRSVVRELPRMLGPLNRRIDLMVETHPDKDHIAGLSDVLETYTVRKFMSPGLPSDTNVYARLVASLSEEPELESYVARSPERIHLGGGAYADVLYPNKDVSHLRATNDASIVLHVVYGNTSVMLTGDLPSTIEDTLVHTVPKQSLRSDVLKAGHHGSKYSTDALWLSAVEPRVAVISAGKGNTYGHPAKEVLSRLLQAGVPVVSTIDQGTITFESDGVSMVRK